jgi:hypothetical protein
MRLDEEVLRSDDGNDSTSLAVIDDLKKKVLELTDQKASMQRKLDDALSEIYVAGCVRESLLELERQNAARFVEIC